MIVLRTIAERWYVAAFLAAYLAAGIPERGWKATVRFALIAFGVALAAEYSSTRNGFPFTRYDYTGLTQGDEVYISNIPLFVPASYAVMIYAGRSVGAWLAPGASPAGLVVAGAVATVALDVVVDPVAVRGEQWFLGDLFEYRTGGLFGVPLGNFAGWAGVSAVVIGLDLLAGRAAPGSEPAEAAVPIGGVLLAGAIVSFNLAVALSIGAVAVALASMGVAALVGTIRLVAPKVVRPAA